MSYIPSSAQASSSAQLADGQLQPPVGFALNFVIRGVNPGGAVEDRIKEVMASTLLLDVYEALLGQRTCTVVVEVKSSARQPEVSFASPGQIRVVVSGKLTESPEDRKQLEKAFKTTGFIALAYRTAQLAVRRGSIASEHQDLLRRLANILTPTDPSSGVGRKTESVAVNRGLVRDLTSQLLKEPPSKSGGKSSKHPRNPHRDELYECAKKLASQIRGRLDCSSPERARSAVDTTL